MASSQSQRQQERLSRQRGAGTHKVENVGFSIQPLGGPAAPLPLSKAVTPPPSELATRGTSRSASRTNSPVAESTVREVLGPSSLREDAISLDMSDAAHRISPNDKKPNLDGPTSSAPSDTPITSAQSVNSKQPAVAAVTPVARGKRTRQPSPDKFLTSPEAAGVAKQLVGRWSNAAADQRQKDKIATRQRGAGTHKIADLGFSIQPIQPVQRPHVEEEWNVVVEVEKVGVADVVREEEVQEQMQGEVQARVVEDEDERDGDNGVREKEDGGGEGEGEASGDQTMKEIETGVEQPVDGEVGESMTQQGVQGMEEEPEDEVPVISVKSPENRNKRRRVILEQEKTPERTEEPMFEPTPQTEVGTSPAQEPKFPKPKRKQQIVEKKPAPLQIPINEEDEDEDEDEDEGGEKEGEEELTQQPPGQQDLSDLERQDSDALPRPKPPKKSSKLSAQPPKQPKPKLRHRAPYENSSSLTFPVLVHRLSKSATYALPPGSNRGGVNPIDVISQVSMEMLDKYWAKSKSNHERKTIEAFKEELGYRFLEMTDAVESNIILAARARQAQKRKAQLMVELLEIKRQRECVAVKMDDVRKAHEIATKSAENQNHISKTFSDITHTLERGKARQPQEGGGGMEGLEALIRKVSNAVTGGGSGGTGLLASVVEFNRFLEKAEVALRERR